MCKTFLLRAVLLIISFNTWAIESSGRVGIEARYFWNGHEEVQAGVLAEPELYWSSDSGNDTFTLNVFARYDELDNRRTHVDIREALWLHVEDSWELRAGIGKVFWGVTESNHLVDIVNQTDSVESADGEQKLGQMMVHISLLKNWGVVELFVLPGFRERTFPGENGRLRGPFIVDVDAAQYESDQGRQHLDFAFRYSHYIGAFDFGLSGFAGTNREPILVPSADAQFELLPYYDQIKQLGVDAQATLGDWLLKFETIYREDSLSNFSAQTIGFEYTLTNMFDSGLDLGLLSEYTHDSRKTPIALDNDIFVGTRLTFNDVQSSELLLGFSQDLKKRGSQLIFIEGSRRIGNSWKATIDVRLFSSDGPNDPINFFIDDEDYSSLTLEWFY